MTQMRPVLQALVLADCVYQDKVTGKKIIAGTFNTIAVQSNDSGQHQERVEAARVRGGLNAGSPWAYICLTEVHGEIELQLQYVDLEHHSVLLKSQPLTVKSKSPLQSNEVIVALPSLPTPHKGVYSLELLTDGYPIGSLRITVVELRIEE